MYVFLSIVCISGLARANVVPAYSDYKDALAYLDKIDTDDMIELLRELVGQRLMDEKSEEAADMYNQQKYVDATPAVGGETIGPFFNTRFFLNF